VFASSIITIIVLQVHIRIVHEATTTSKRHESGDSGVSSLGGGCVNVCRQYFVLACPSDRTFTVGEFARTRFGTTKAQTDNMYFREMARQAGVI
jgi:hypothetical protein